MAEQIGVRGLTLIEVIIALFIVALVIVAVLTLLPSSLLAVKRADTQLRAESLAQSLLEDRRSQSFESLILNSTYQKDVVAVETFKTEVRVVKAGDVDPDFARQVEVTVVWRLGGRDRQVKRSTVVARVTR